MSDDYAMPSLINGLDKRVPSHASGGLVTRTMPAPDPTWKEQLPLYKMVDPSFRSFGDPMADSADNIGIQYPDEPHSFTKPQDFVEPPTSHATGGPVDTIAGTGPAGSSDDGYITARVGEYVLQRAAVKCYGQRVLDAINACRIDPKALAAILPDA